MRQKLIIHKFQSENIKNTKIQYYRSKIINYLKNEKKDTPINFNVEMFKKNKIQ